MSLLVSFKRGRVLVVVVPVLEELLLCAVVMAICLACGSLGVVRVLVLHFAEVAHAGVERVRHLIDLLFCLRERVVRMWKALE